jgi:hypothetical protein
MLEKLKQIGISDQLAESIDMFLVNGPLSNDQKDKVIGFLNLAYVEGTQSRLRSIQDNHGKFMSEFSKKIIGDGLDSENKETPEGGR